MPANYVLLQRTTLTQDSASVLLDGIPSSGYTDLKLVISARGSYAGEFVAIRVNPNSQTANITSRIMYGTGSAVDKFGDTIVYGNIPASTATANTFGVFEFHIFNYLSATAKGFLGEGYTGNRSTAALTVFSASRWNDNTAISSLQIAATTGNLVTGSEFSLYGLVNTTTTPVVSPFASGGDLIDNDGTYWYHAFLNSGQFVPAKALSCDYLVVAGGGGGSGGYGAGGGAGGFRTFTNQSLSTQPFNVLIGAGGPAGPANSVHLGMSGTSSSFGGVSATGGGGAGTYASNNAFSGGSGGGGGGESTPGGAGNAGGYTPVEGYAGGTGGTATRSGGGGGAGGAGNPPVGNTCGAGGVGATTAISGGSTTGLGALSSGSYYFAGGGGGGGDGAQSLTGGAGGIGGGGAGSSGSVGSNATANTGGGGGGGGRTSGVTRNGGAGGSGIVIVRYPMV